MIHPTKDPLLRCVLFMHPIRTTNPLPSHWTVEIYSPSLFLLLTHIQRLRTSGSSHPSRTHPRPCPHAPNDTLSPILFLLLCSLLPRRGKAARCGGLLSIGDARGRLYDEHLPSGTIVEGGVGSPSGMSEDDNTTSTSPSWWAGRRRGTGSP